MKTVRKWVESVNIVVNLNQIDGVHGVGMILENIFFHF